MRLILFILICFTHSAYSFVFEKTRFDRAVNNNDEQNESFRHKWTFTDAETEYIAYKSKDNNECYIEKLRRYRNPLMSDVLEKEWNTRYVSHDSVTKVEAWRIAGGRIVEFCHGRNMFFLTENKPINNDITDPFMNEIPFDENDITTKRVADVVITPLLTRAKREIQLEKREKLNRDYYKARTRRQTHRGRFRGQTQSQYLNIGTNEEKDGKAEAEATHESSRATVSGSHGMGQAQSMSSSGAGCEDCPGYTDVTAAVDQIPHKLQLGPGKTGFKAPSSAIPGTIIYPGRTVPGTVTTGGRVPYPGGTVPGTMTTGGHIMYPGGAVPETGTTGGRVTYPGGAVPETGTIGGRVTYPGGAVPETGTTGGRVTYPEGAVSGTGTTGGRVMYPGGTISETGTTGGRVMYPGGSVPETGTTGGRVTYPGGAVPETGTTGGRVTYPGGAVPETGTTGGRVTYPGGAVPETGTTGGRVTYPGGAVPATGTAGQVTYPAGTLPGTMMISYPRGIVPAVAAPGTGAVGGVGSYPGAAVPGTMITRGGIPYPEGVVSRTGTYPRGGVVPGTVPVEGGVVYPGGVMPGTVPESVSTGGDVRYGGTVAGTVSTDKGVTYPGSAIPGTVSGTGPGVVSPKDGLTYPRINVPGTVSTGTTGTGTYPGDGASSTGTTGGGIIYPGGVVPGSEPTGRMPSGTGIAQPGVHYFPGTLPGTVPSDGAYAFPGSGTVSYQGGTVTPESRPLPGTVPNVVAASKVAADTSVFLPGGTQPTAGQAIPGISRTGSTGTIIPHGGVVQPGTQQVVIPAQGHLGGSRPGENVPQIYPGGGIYPVSRGFYPGVQMGGQYPVPDTQYQPEQYPGGSQYFPGAGVDQLMMLPGGAPSALQYPRGTAVSGSMDATQRYQIIGPAALAKEDEASDSQASSSVKQIDDNTQASASAQGKYGQGTAQSQVSGTYSGSSSFSAQAGTSDGNRSAQSQISGGKDGASSNAEGIGGRGKSQTQVQLNSESGATSTGAQSRGWNHGTNSQVQASSKGGMADAQANGEGSTSSQAQIGFHPYFKNNDEVEKYTKPFRGGGTASAQSGTYSGQSQSQLQGSFQYGITYTGAAQAGSGSGAATSRKPFNFNLTDSEFYKSFKPQNSASVFENSSAEAVSTQPDASYDKAQKQHQDLQSSSSSSQQTVVTTSGQSIDAKTKNQPIEKTRIYEYEDNEGDDDAQYEDEEYDSLSEQNPSFNSESFSSANRELNNHKDQQQLQMIQFENGNKYDVNVAQDSNLPKEGDLLQPGQSVPGYTIPPGFRGRVTSVSGGETSSNGDGEAQSQTVTLAAKRSNVTQVTEARSLHSNYANVVSSKNSDNNANVKMRSLSNGYTHSSINPRPSYYTITNSIAGKMDDSRNSPKKYEHRYYTKSSTCGYFTFSCNIVYGSNGRTKICKPKVPTYPDGTPMKC